MGSSWAFSGNTKRIFQNHKLLLGNVFLSFSSRSRSLSYGCCVWGYSDKANLCSISLGPSNKLYLMLSHHLDPGTSVAHTEVPQCVGGVFIITKEGFLSPGGAHIFLADESFKLSHPGCRSSLIQSWVSPVWGHGSVELLLSTHHLVYQRPFFLNTFHFSCCSFSWESNLLRSDYSYLQDND